jgi:hypothetical protein
MALKILLLALLAPLFVGALAVFDAASKTAYALAVIDAAQSATSPSAHREMLAQAERTIAPGLEATGSWHAGAAEVRSGLALLHAEAENDPVLLPESAHWAERAVMLAPVQPNAWARLALLAEDGEQNSACAEKVCLERSWLTAPMLGGETGCVRLKLAQRHGWLARNDPRIEQYALSGSGAAQIARCLQFLGPDAVFHALLRRAQ